MPIKPVTITPTPTPKPLTVEQPVNLLENTLGLVTATLFAQSTF
jgi:hypothetical protein